MIAMVAINLACLYGILSIYVRYRCAFVQWQPEYLSETGEEVFDIQMVERDRAWFETNRPKLKSFYDDLMEARRRYVKPPPPACLVSLTLYDDAIASEGSEAKKPRLMFCDESSSV